MLSPVSNNFLNKWQTVKPNYPQPSIQSKPNSPNSGNSNNKDVFFSAKEYPSEIYSEWFVEKIKSKMDLPEEEYEKWAKEELNAFRIKRQEEKYNEVIEGDPINTDYYKEGEDNDVESREKDYFNLITDIKNAEKTGQEIPTVDCKFDEPIGKYSSEQNYNGLRPYAPASDNCGDFCLDDDDDYLDETHQFDDNDLLHIILGDGAYGP